MIKDRHKELGYLGGRHRKSLYLGADKTVPLFGFILMGGTSDIYHYFTVYFFRIEFSIWRFRT